MSVARLDVVDVLSYTHSYNRSTPIGHFGCVYCVLVCDGTFRVRHTNPAHLHGDNKQCYFPQLHSTELSMSGLLTTNIQL